MQILRLFLRIVLFRAKPDAVPYSIFLFLLLFLLLGVLKSVTNLYFVSIVSLYSPKLHIHMSFEHAMIVSAVYLLVLVGCVHTTLAIYKVPERTVQVVSAMAGVDLFFNLAYYLWVFALGETQLPLQAGSFSSIALLLVFILLLYWQFMVYIHIFFNSINITVLRAWVFALVYMLLQHNVSEMLMSVLVETSRN